jgi:hypothetical protein
MTSSISIGTTTGWAASSREGGASSGAMRLEDYEKFPLLIRPRPIQKPYGLRKHLGGQPAINGVGELVLPSDDIPAGLTALVRNT